LFLFLKSLFCLLEGERGFVGVCWRLTCSSSTEAASGSASDARAMMVERTIVRRLRETWSSTGLAAQTRLFSMDALFDTAVAIVQGLPKSGPIQTDYEDKIGMYSLSTPATVGNVSGSRPPMWDMLGRAKWSAACPAHLQC
jgi:acyl-CoA-binding protein